MLDKINKIKEKLQNLNELKIQLETKKKMLDNDKKEILDSLRSAGLTYPELVSKIKELKAQIEVKINELSKE